MALRLKVLILSNGIKKQDNHKNYKELIMPDII